MLYSSKKIQGFTLVEMLLVVFLIAVLATTAITSYVNSTDTFRFLQGFKQVMSSLRTARSYATTDKQQDEKKPKYYGVCLSQDRAIVFADRGDKELKMDLSPADLEDLGNKGLGIGACNQAAGSGEKYDTVILDKIFRFDDKGYLLKAFDAKSVPGVIAMPIFIFYETGSGNLSVFDGGGAAVAKNENKFINLEFTENGTDRKKIIKVMQVSGLADEVE